MMSSNRTTLQISDQCMANLREIKESNGLKSITAAIEYAAAAHVGTQEAVEQQRRLERTLAQHKKYLNELRRNDYLIIALMNAITLSLDVSYAPPHHDKLFRSQALQAAHENLSAYLDSIMTRNMEYSDNSEVQNE